jgi:hypothetical protein
LRSYKTWRVADSNTACYFFLWGYLKAKVYEQRPQTLEALKEAIRQEVAAITPEMILNYREMLHHCINIQGHHLSGFYSKHVDVERKSVYFPEIKTICLILFVF